MKAYRKGDYSLQKISPEDWKLFKDIRLEAVKNEPSFFGRGYDEEVTIPDQEWVDRLNNPDRAYFALKYSNEIIGLTGIVRTGENKQQAGLIASYIRSEHRGLGLSQLFYQARLDWANDNGIDEIIVSHRKRNLSSKAANQKFGFKYTHTVMAKWPDGTEEEQLFYKLDLTDHSRPSRKFSGPTQ